MYRAHANEKVDLESRLESTDQSIVTLEGGSEGVEEQYQFFQEMRGYVRDLVECLNEKVRQNSVWGLCGVGRIYGWACHTWAGASVKGAMHPPF